MKNLEIARIFHEIADILEVQGVQFKPRAYRRAARSIEELSEDIAKVAERNELERIPGVGENIAKKIRELLKTGRLKYFEKLKKEMPFDIEGMTAPEGMGVKKAYLLYRKLGVKTLKQLEKAAKRGKIRKLAGFGETSEKRILESIEALERAGDRMTLWSALVIAGNLKAKLEKVPGVRKAEVVGSLRRMRETIGDLDVLVISKKPAAVMDFFVSMPEVDRVLGKGRTKSSVELESGLHVDLRVVGRESFGSAMQYFTGSKYHNIATRRIAIKKGLKLSEYGLFRGKKQVAGATEQEVYKALGMQYVEPELRENTGEVEAALKKKLPRLVSMKDIRGDLHCHTDWSEGNNTIGEMAEQGKRLGYEYMAISDHGGMTLRVANPLDEKRLAKQGKEIDRLNKLGSRKGWPLLLKSSEINIMKDGGVDIKDSTLKELDIVLASIHGAMRQPKEKIMKRLFSAMENEHVDVIAHPTGRIINRREAYALDFPALLDKAKETGTLLEINAQPDRLDLNSRMVKEAIGKTKLTIGTDAHRDEHMNYMPLGVAMARRGWCEKRHIANAMKLKDLRRLFGF